MVSDQAWVDGYTSTMQSRLRHAYERVTAVLEEKRRLIMTLDSCLSQPGNTWLTKDVVNQATNSGVNLDNAMLKEVITTMVTVRDQLQKEVDEAEERRCKIVLTNFQTLRVSSLTLRVMKDLG